MQGFHISEVDALALFDTKCRETYQASCPPLSVSVSGLLFREGHYSCTALLFFLMPKCIQALYSPMFYIHLCVALVYVSHLRLTSSGFVSQIHAFMRLRCLSFKSCISYTALRPRFVSGCPSCINYTALASPALFLLPLMYHILGLMPPSLFPLLVTYPAEYSAAHWGDTSRWV